MTPAGVLGLLLLVASTSACTSVPPGGGVDAGDDGPDGGEGAGGLHLRFHATPGVGAALGGEFDCSLGAIELVLGDLRVLGDAAPSNATRVDSFALVWSGDDGDGDGADGDLRSGDEADPDVRSVRFDEAPPGLYSSVRAGITGYDIEGTAMLESLREYEIEDEQAGLGFTLTFDEVMLDAGETLTIDVDVSLDDLVRAIDWDEVPAGDGDVLKVDDESDQIDDVRDELEDAFAVRVPDPA